MTWREALLRVLLMTVSSAAQLQRLGASAAKPLQTRMLSELQIILSSRAKRLRASPALRLHSLRVSLLDLLQP